MKKRYKAMNFSADRQVIITRAIQLVEDYQRQGYSLTLRQLYYQFVSRDWFPQSWADSQTGSTNNERSYKKLGDVISDARMAGQVDWGAIEDRTREVAGNSHWDSPADILSSAARSFQIDKWEGQEYRVEVWVEKDALEGVVARAARELDVSYFSCRGYASMTSIWDAGQRLLRYAKNGQTPVILHLGDHDPSGIDMSRDIEQRVSLFMDGSGSELVFRRIALTMEQVREWNPPPNPAKVTDSRFRSYENLYGDESWELDALEPSVIDGLIRDEIGSLRNDGLFEVLSVREAEHRENLEWAAKNWITVVKQR